MKNIYTGIAILLVLSLSVGCRRQPLPERPQEPDREYISISATAPDETKAFIGSSDLTTTGTRVNVVDYLTGFTGSFDGVTYTSGDLVYFDDAVQYGTNSWEFVSGSLWQWTRTGTHHFFGWLEHDNLSDLHASAFNNSSGSVEFNRTTKAFTIPTIEFTKNSPQFDLCYSDWVDVDAATRQNNNVSLPLNHAFMALAVYITNKSADEITIKSAQFTSGFKNIKSASYAPGGSGLVYANPGSSEFLATTYDNPTLTRNTRIDLVQGEQISAATRPTNTILMWPQTADEVEATKIHLEYTIDGIYDPSDHTKLLVISRDLDLNLANLKDDLDHTLPMEAGHKYFLEILFSDKEIKLVLNVLPWTMDYTDTSYSSSAIVAKSDAPMEGVLWLWNWNGVTWDAGPRNRNITLTNGKVEGRFYIESPQEGEWQIDVYPASAAQYYKIAPMNGQIADLVLNEVIFEVRPNTALTPPSTQELHFNVNIRIGGEWRNANTEFNRKDWKLYLNP